MKQLLTLILITFAISATTTAQEPGWINETKREMSYPASVFLQGFAQDQLEKKESLSDAIESLKDIARANLSKSIITHIESVSENYSKSEIKKGNERFSETYTQTIKAETKAEISGLKTEHYFDEKSKKLYAFAYANKYEVIGYYKANINLTLQQIKSAIEAAKSYEQKGEKQQAIKEYESTAELFARLSFAQNLLIALNSGVSNDELKTAETSQHQQQVLEALILLNQGTKVYIQCTADLFGQNTTVLENKLKAQLSTKDCQFVESAENADWQITINAKAREYNNPNNMYFSYVDITVSVIKIHLNKEIYKDQWKQKGGGISYKAAAESAYKKLTNSLTEKVIPLIE